MRKRYYLFTYDSYYPNGGLSDIAGRFDNLSEVKTYLESLYKTNVFSRNRKITSKGKKYLVVEEICQVTGPDSWEVLDLDTGDEIITIQDLQIPKSYERELSRSQCQDPH